MALARGTVAAFAFVGAGCLQVAHLDGDFTKTTTGNATGTSSSASTGTSTGTSSSTGSGGAATRTVSGVETIHFVHSTQTGATVSDVHPDLSSTPIAALVLDGNKFGTPITGTGFLNGTFQIDNVPVGPYYLLLRDPYYDGDYYVTDSDDVDMSLYVLGRPDAVAATSNTPLTLNVGNLSPWAATNRLEIISAGAGTAGLDLTSGAATNPPFLGATNLAMTIDTSKLLVPNLLNNAQGDAAGLMQLTSQTTPVPYQSISRFTAFAITQSNGMATNVNASFNTVGTTTPIAVNWKTSMFEAEKTLVHPSASVVAHDFMLQVEFGDPTYGIYSATPDILAYSPAPNSGDVGVTLMYDRPPLTNSWYTYASAVSTYGVPQSTPGGTVTTTNTTSFYLAPLATFTGAEPIVPTVSPPLNATIDQQAFSGNGTLASDQPTLSWDPPTMGSVTSYVVRIASIAANGKRVLVGQLTTSATGLTVPPGLLTSGTYYVINVRATAMAGITYSKTPSRETLPVAGASTLSGVWRAP